MKLGLRYLPESEEIPETVNLSISVTDGENPVEGATVSIGEINSTTGRAGGCTLQNVPVGNRLITVTADGYDEYSDTITVSDEHDEFTITLTEV